ncbi:uncharacterized protein LOC120496480 [Passer montanus]|uniref:uncharacterized protein LOC120496480 n=1 Tax=Passer montanus TaxID=9160 RepID=UPI001961FE48|nr:uncharacterized protein LOC120496480 [Passer montanus]
MRRARGAALATLMIVSAVRAQLEQEPFLETVEGSSISIKCSHPNIQRGDFIHWYRQLPGKGPELVVMTVQASKEVRSPEGRLTVSADRRRSALWLGRPRRGDAAVYYCALGPRAEEPGLRPGTNRRGRGRAGPAGGAAAPARPGLRHRDRHRHRQWTSAPEPAPPRTQAPVAIPVLAPTTAPTPAPAPAFSHRPCSAPLLSPGCVRLSRADHWFVSFFSLAVAVVRAQVQQEQSLETTEGIGINITCSHPNIRMGEMIYWYRQLPGKGPEFLVLTVRETKELPDSAGRVWVSADRRGSALWLGRPRRGDAAVYYCALGPRAEEPGLRPGTNRRGRGRAGPAGGAAAPA